MMKQWNTLQTLSDLDVIVAKSKENPCVIYKHSTTCPVNHAAKSRLESGWDIIPPQVELYYLDLLTYRDVSNAVAEKFGIKHQSPQVLLIIDGQCVYDESHFEITPQLLAKEIDMYL